MIGRIAALLFTATIGLCAGFCLAQAAEEPVRLKKKAKSESKEPAPDKPGTKSPPAKPEKPAQEKQPKDEPTPDAPAPPQEDEDLLLQRVAKNLRSAEEKLGKGDLGEATRQVQDDILKDLDALLRRNQQASQSSQSSSQEKSDNDRSQDNQQDQQPGAAGKQSAGESAGKSSSRSRMQRRERQQARGSRRSQPSKNDKSGPPMDDGTPMASAASKEKGDEPNGQLSSKDSRGKGREGQPNRAADVYKEVWGHLPESLRAEMNAYFNDRQFMAKYDELIKRYYSSIAEKGRRREK